METITLLLFCALLLFCLIFHLSVLYALAAGLVIFLIYGRKRGFSFAELLRMCLEGIKTAGNILTTFVLIGILTALWRASGTIPAIICYASVLIRPSIFLLVCFLLNCALSFLTGTSLGTAATMGVICASVATAMGIPAFLVGGAVLSGAYFGDRCSPVSTSALLVANLTGTNIFDNIRAMMKTAAIPFATTCALYLLIGLLIPHNGNLPDLTALFTREFRLHWVALLPAALILLLSFFRVPVKITMLGGILPALLICRFFQEWTWQDILSFSLLGYQARDTAVAGMMNGGGLLSMAKVAAIVCISSAYSGIFHRTGLLGSIRRFILLLSEKATPFCTTLLTAILAVSISCNQTLGTMLTQQLCQDTEPDRQRFAIDLEDTVIIIAPLIPWSIAGATPLAAIGAPTASILFAFFLYLVPVCGLIRSFFSKKYHIAH
ncbi:MAG: sodium:proton antiporter [Clostridiales bacterium]|nr:sodium:proton antiporter [Clostridiales bacterium]